MGVRELEGHGGAVLAVAFSPDGKSLASAGADGAVKLWSPALGKPQAALDGHERSANGLAFAPEGRPLASCGSDGTIRLWAGGEGRILVDAKSPIRAIDYSPDGKLVASGGTGDLGNLRVWDAETGACVRTFGGHGKKSMLVRDGGMYEDDEWETVERSIYAVACSPGGKGLASAGETGQVKLWDVAKGDEICAIEGAERKDDTGRFGFRPDDFDIVRSLDFSPDGLLLAAAGNAAEARIYDVKKSVSAKPSAGVLALEVEASAPVRAVAFLPSGKSIALACGDGTVRLHDAAKGKERSRIGGEGAAATCLAVSPDGRTVAWGDEKGMVRIAAVP